MKDSLGNRMKEYEVVTKMLLPRRSYTMLRIDGKAFHTYTKGLKRPFDEAFIADMNDTAAYLCQNIMGARLAYVQSDEISILTTDFDEIATEAWFKNNVQKMVSISASMATAIFNKFRNTRDMLSDKPINKTLPMFDSRVFQIPQKTEVENYFIWRQQDATRNSIASVAQSLYSHKELNGKSSDQQQELIFQKGTNWNDYPIGQKRGRILEKITFVNGVDVRTIPFQEIKGPLMLGNEEIGPADVVRNKWMVVEPPVFTQDRHFLSSRIPNNK